MHYFMARQRNMNMNRHNYLVVILEVFIFCTYGP
jgi:hypothetical protein